MKSQTQTKLIDRRMREDWQAEGEKDIYQRAREKVIEIRETFEPPPLSDDVKKTLRNIVEEAEHKLGVTRK
jgi:trimethylamine--corrinoid protein Co-methyltransferase